MSSEAHTHPLSPTVLPAVRSLRAADPAATREAPTVEQIRLVATSAQAGAGAVSATFTLDAVPDPMWRGAFAQALAGTLDGVAGRWYLERAAITVTRMRTGHAEDVALAVRAAIDRANRYISDRAEAYESRLVASEAADVDLRRDADAAAAAIHAALGV